MILSLLVMPVSTNVLQIPPLFKKNLVCKQKLIMLGMVD